MMSYGQDWPDPVLTFCYCLDANIDECQVLITACLLFNLKILSEYISEYSLKSSKTHD